MRQTAIRRGIRIHQDEPREPIGTFDRRTHPDAASPVVGHEGDFLQVERLCQAYQIRDMPVERVVVVCRLVRHPAANVIDGNAAALRRQRGDESPPGKTPGRVAMHEQQHGS